MAKIFRVVVADSEYGVLRTAQDRGWTVVKPIREFTEIDTLDDMSLGNPGRLFVKTGGFVALAYKEAT
ncbi:hypothetical protein ACFWZ3_17210 [Frateuria sp. GZRR35]|uniref:hypothetical protein n=1 Tax=Frateuria sp. GZRR35 TaxID=3351536 RepID=UPI003EDB7F43